MQGPPSKTFLIRSQIRLREREVHDAEALDAARHDLDGDEAEAAATRHAEERRARREAVERESREP